MSFGNKQDTDADMEASWSSNEANFVEPLYAKLEELQKELKFDNATLKKTWDNYGEISSYITLEGDKVHWLACCLFITYRKTKSESVKVYAARSKSFNMTLLLRLCDMSLNHFFANMKSWITMAKLPKEFLKEVELAEKNFIVCQNVYKHYLTNFKKLFRIPDSESIRLRKKLTHCTPISVFEFTWVLFILLKGKYMRCADDLVECLKILFACCNLSFRNAFLLNQRDVLNLEFDGLPADWHLPTYQLPAEAPCALDKLIGTQGLLEISDVKYTQDYKVHPKLVQLINEGKLKGNKKDLSGFFSPENIDNNYASLTKIYEEYIAEESCFDEKIFLAEAYRQSVLQSMRCSNGDAIMDTPINDRRVAVCQTPLTGRHYMGPREPNEGNGAADSKAKLTALLANRPSGMSDKISEMIAECGGENLGEKVVNVVSVMSEKLLGDLTSGNAADPNEIQTMTTKLFYCILEMILVNEKRMNRDLSVLEKPVFHECVYVCAAELLVYVMALPPQFHFPWVLTALDMPASHFVRIIELIVRSKHDFPRDIIKHLSYVEESILDSLMWRSDSVLWEDLARCDYSIPKFEEIAQPGTTINMANLVNTMSSRRALFPPGAASTSTSETFQSPRYSNIRPGQSLLNSNRNQLAVQNAPNSTQNGTNTNANSPRRNLSFSIILRKFYVLAYVRMDDLCRRLRLNDTEFRMKIWTVFEHSIRKTDLIKNRHLDQLIMCAVYVICKLDQGSNMKFTEIMNCYRAQPQSNRDIYRSVYIDETGSDNLIMFYNKIYVMKVKKFVLQFTRSSDIESLTLSPLPATTPLVSPRSQITRNVFVNSLESPTSLSGEFNNPHSYCFNRSDSRDLKNINKAINGRAAKRLLADDLDSDSKRFTNSKIQAMMEEREVQHKTTQ